MNITRKQWIEALKSGKYKQTTQVLGNTVGHCCLGVACEIAGFEKMLDDDAYLYMIPDGDGWPREQRTVLTYNMSRKLRLNDEYFVIPYDLLIRLDAVSPHGWSLESLLMTLNDRGYTFEQIADLLIFDSWLRGIEQDG